MPAEGPLSGLSINTPRSEDSFIEGQQSAIQNAPQDKAQDFWLNMYHIVLRDLGGGTQDA